MPLSPIISDFISYYTAHYSLLQPYWYPKQTFCHFKVKVQKALPPDISVANYLPPSCHHPNLIFSLKPTLPINTAICSQLPALLIFLTLLIFFLLFHSISYFLTCSIINLTIVLIVDVCLSPLNFKFCLDRDSYLFYSFIGSKHLDQGQEHCRCSITGF